MALSTHDELLMLRKRARRRLVGAVVLVSLSTAVLWNVVDALPERPMQPEAVDITGLQSSAPRAVVPAVVAPAAPLAASQPEAELLATLPAEDAITAPPPAAQQPTVVAPAASAVVAVKPRPAPEPTAAVRPDSSRVEAPKVTPPVPEPAKPKPKPERALANDKPKDVAPKVDPMAILEGRDAAPAKPRAEAKDGAKDETAGKRFNIQLAALSDPDKVAALKDKLAAAGVNARYSKLQTSKGEVTRVRVGPFASREAADAALRRMSRAGVNGIVVAD